MPQIHHNDEIPENHSYTTKVEEKVMDGTSIEVLDSYFINEFVKVDIRKDLETSRIFYSVTTEQLKEREIKTLEKMKESLSNGSDNSINFGSFSEREEYINQILKRILAEDGVNPEEVSLSRLKYFAKRDYLGYGKIDALLSDGNVEDISCDGVGIPLYVYHKKYQNLRTNIVFDGTQELNNFIVYLAQKGNKQISVSDPILDTSTPEGNRINATYGKEVTAKGGTFSIRIFNKVPFSAVDLVKLGTASQDLMSYLWLSVENGKNIVVLGGTGVGKTSTLNAITLFVPSTSKIVSIEDTREIKIPHKNWISAVTRSGVGEGRFVMGKNSGEIDMFDLLVSALRQRPDYLIVGEVRGMESYNLFQAMSMGQTTITTIHAESIDDMIMRLENHPLNIPRTMLTSVNCVVKQSMVRINEGVERRITEVSEVLRLDPESNELTFNTIFSWDKSKDMITFTGEPELLKEIADKRNVSSEIVREDFNKRSKLIKYLADMNITNYTDIWEYLRRYSEEPEKISIELNEYKDERGVSSVQR